MRLFMSRLKKRFLQMTTLSMMTKSNWLWNIRRSWRKQISRFLIKTWKRRVNWSVRCRRLLKRIAIFDVFCLLIKRCLLQLKDINKILSWVYDQICPSRKEIKEEYVSPMEGALQKWFRSQKGNNIYHIHSQLLN